MLVLSIVNCQLWHGVVVNVLVSTVVVTLCLISTWIGG